MTFDEVCHLTLEFNRVKVKSCAKSKRCSVVLTPSLTPFNPLTTLTNTYLGYKATDSENSQVCRVS